MKAKAQSLKSRSKFGLRQVLEGAADDAELRQVGLREQDAALHKGPEEVVERGLRRLHGLEGAVDDDLPLPVRLGNLRAGP